MSENVTIVIPFYILNSSEFSPAGVPLQKMKEGDFDFYSLFVLRN
jgi:hypothetical protein